ncbi:MAG: P-loop NTPase, partial [Oscillospiraceae bacterium]|nr:P-loop NTPase [Oscillospiraceae bacterium]
AEDWFVCQDWSACIDSIDMCIECDELVDIYITAIELSPEGVEYIDREGEFASALFAGTVSFYLGFNYVDHTNEVYDREDRVYYNTIYGKGAAELRVPFTGTVTILIPHDGTMELNSSEFDEVVLGDEEIIDYELTPYRNDDDPYFAECPDCGKKINVFGQSKLDEVAKQYELDILGRMPINPKLAAACDKGAIELYAGDWLDAAADKIEAMK